jgi:hypothetical protein
MQHCQINLSHSVWKIQQMVHIGKPSIELRVKTAYFHQFFFNGNPDFFQGVWLLGIPPGIRKVVICGPQVSISITASGGSHGSTFGH